MPNTHDHHSQEAKTAADAVWNYMTTLKHVQRRDGRLDTFDPLKIERSVRAAFEATGLSSGIEGGPSREISEQVVTQLQQRFDGHATPTTVDIRDMVAAVLMDRQFGRVAQAYIGYRLGMNVPKDTVLHFQETATPVVVATTTPRRHRLNEERKAITHKFQVGSHEGYLTVGLYDETRQPGEIFLRMSKEGSVMSGLVDAFATSISIGLQYGVPLKVFVNKFSNMRFEPSGATQNPNIPNAKSIVDYVFRWLALKFLTPEERQSLLSASEENPTIDRQPKLIEPNSFDLP